MKKLLTIAAVAALAVAAQAATTTWGSGTLNIAASADGGWGTKTVAANAGNQIVTMNIYFITAAEYDSMASDTQKQIYDAYKGETADLTGKNLNANNAAIGAITIKDTASAASVIYAVAIATYTDSSLGKDFYMATTVKSGYNSATSTGTATGIFTSASTKNWQAVPEPTTVALLALGLAAVGLKRKVA